MGCKATLAFQQQGRITIASKPALKVLPLSVMISSSPVARVDTYRLLRSNRDLDYG